ncbi:MAG: hypothetical protein ACO4AJ_15080, partial [Prochlorothrix sp.]
MHLTTAIDSPGLGPLPEITPSPEITSEQTVRHLKKFKFLWRCPQQHQGCGRRLRRLPQLI